MLHRVLSLQMIPKHKWAFRSRFRANAFGWRSDLPIKRIREALSEIRKVRPALYPQIAPQNPCTRVSPRRGAQIMVIPLASAATQVWPVCKGSLWASRLAAICCVPLTCNGTTMAARARLAYDHRATRCGAICGYRAGQDARMPYWQRTAPCCCWRSSPHH